ncbi:hypothetical protein [Pararhizobium sp. A13]|uniref:hypothetical protein n=1 Tax=Pararhizobium sp. A13 TaxID=3133975 RepID=UPI0032DBA0E7
MHVQIKHVLNERAKAILSAGPGCASAVIPKSLNDWICNATFHGEYFLGPQEATDKQIGLALETYKDPFSIETFLNKVHLEDDAPDLGFEMIYYIQIYFSACDYFGRYLISNNIKKPLLLCYSTDADDPASEYPSHTMKFGFPRTGDDYYYLNVDSYRANAFVGTLVTVSDNNLEL